MCRGLSGCNGSVPFPDTNNGSPSVPKIMNGTAVWQNSSLPQQLLQNGRSSVLLNTHNRMVAIEILHEQPCKIGEKIIIQ